MKRGIIPIILVLYSVFTLGALEVQAASQKPSSDAITYRGKELRAGDMIVFHGGPFDGMGEGNGYGHTSIYLGRDPKTGAPTFLDFTLWRDPLHPSRLFKKDPFYARVLTEEAFLKKYREDNSAGKGKGGRPFDVFRAKAASDPDKVNRALLWDEALRIAKTRGFGSENVCSTAALEALEKGLGVPFGDCDRSRTARLGGERTRITPNGIAHGGCFEKVNADPLAPGDLEKVARERQLLWTRREEAGKALSEVRGKLAPLRAQLSGKEARLGQLKTEMSAIEERDLAALAPKKEALNQEVRAWNDTCSGRKLSDSEYEDCARRQGEIKSKKGALDQEYAAARSRIAATQAPLSREISALEAEIGRIKSQADLLVRKEEELKARGAQTDEALRKL